MKLDLSVLPTANDTTTERVFAAIDIGSNSFHLIVARLEHGEIRIRDHGRHGDGRPHHLRRAEARRKKEVARQQDDTGLRLQGICT